MSKGILRVTDELIKEIFLLPDSYKIISCGHNNFTNELVFEIESPDIPKFDDHLATIKPIYKSKPWGLQTKVELQEIKII